MRLEEGDVAAEELDSQQCQEANHGGAAQSWEVLGNISVRQSATTGPSYLGFRHAKRQAWPAQATHTCLPALTGRC